MTGDKTKFVSLKAKERGFVTYGDNNKGKILCVGNIGNSINTSIENVLYVEELKHNLLSISVHFFSSLPRNFIRFVIMQKTVN